MSQAVVDVYVNKRPELLLIGLAATFFVGVSGIIAVARRRRRERVRDGALEKRV